MKRGFSRLLLVGLVALTALPAAAADGPPGVPAAGQPPLKLDRRSLAPAPDYALPRARGTVSAQRIAEQGWQHCALSFDDGPNEITPGILAILDREHVVATYFPVAATAARHPDVIRAFVAGGHEIGNHSLAHRNLAKLSPAAQRADLVEANRILRGLGAAPVLFRPPYAAYNPGLVSIARTLGLETVLWSLDVRDWEYRDAGMLAARVQAGAGPALVVLLHATYEWTERALPRIIAALRDHGCRFVTLSQWIAFMGAPPAPAAPTASTVMVAATPQPAAPASSMALPPALFARAEPPAAPAHGAMAVASGDAPAPAVLVADAGAPPPAAGAGPTAATRGPLALTLKPARLALGRGGKTTLEIDGDGAVLQLGADADIDAIADQLRAALEKR